MDEDLLTALRAVPALGPFEGQAERLGGLTNRVFRLGDKCLRLPGKGTQQYIDRTVEAVAAREAAKAGLGPELLHFDKRTGIMVTRFVDDADPMSPARFKAKRGAPARAGEALRKLHDSSAVFPVRFEIFAMIDAYLEVLRTRTVALPDDYRDVVGEAGRSVRAALNARELPSRPCHCDPVCENFLDTGTRMLIVDWEYSGMNDPMWDLGDLAVEADFDGAQEEEMLRSYFGGEPSAAERGRIVAYKAMSDLLWTLWGLIQVANANPAEDFRLYADTRFARCKALMATPDFRRHLAAVRKG